VTIAPRSKSYGTISRGQTGVNTFTLTGPTTQGLGVPVVFSAKVTFPGSLSPTTAHLAEHQPARPADRAEVDGTWTFSVVDVASDDTGFIGAVSLHLNGFVRRDRLSVPRRSSSTRTADRSARSSQNGA
jgi:hypothetical protein